MSTLKTNLNARSTEFRANAGAMSALVADLRAKIDQVALGGGEAARAKHVARSKLLPRERVRTLLDAGSPFLELSQLAALNMYDNEAPCAGIITGIGRIPRCRANYGVGEKIDSPARRGNPRAALQSTHVHRQPVEG